MVWIIYALIQLITIYNMIFIYTKLTFIHSFTFFSTQFHFSTCRAKCSHRRFCLGRFYYAVYHRGNKFPKLVQGWSVVDVKNVVCFKKHVYAFNELVTTGDGHTIQNQIVLIWIVVSASCKQEWLGESLIFLLRFCFDISATLKKLRSSKLYINF